MPGEFNVESIMFQLGGLHAGVRTCTNEWPGLGKGAGDEDTTTGEFDSTTRPRWAAIRKTLNLEQQSVGGQAALPLAPANNNGLPVCLVYLGPL